MVKITRDELVYLDDGCTICLSSRDTGLVDGYEPHVLVVDEQLYAKTTDMIETLLCGVVLRSSYLTSMFLTAGSDMNGSMF